MARFELLKIQPMAFAENIRCEYVPTGRRCFQGFSLIELLSVIAIIALLMALLAPAISSFGGAGARKGAVATVMGTLEQARVAALESGRNVMVVFARPSFPERDALMVVRETEDGTGNYEALTRWIRLPKKVLLHEPSAGDSIFSANLPSAAFDADRLPLPPPAQTNKPLSALVFNASGAVEFPVNKEQRSIRITEGVRGENGQEALTVAGFEMLSVARFTGRTQLDISYDE